MPEEAPRVGLRLLSSIWYLCRGLPLWLIIIIDDVAENLFGFVWVFIRGIY